MLLPLVHVHDVAEAVLRALRTRSTPAQPLDLVGPGMPTQAEYLTQLSAARRERMVAVYVPAGRLLCTIAAFESARAVRAIAYRLAWATQSVRYDGGPLAQALGWCPSIDLPRGLARHPAPASASRIALGAPSMAPTPQP
jgi:nucleoside-diphosphate-sugar epimerase